MLFGWLLCLVNRKAARMKGGRHFSKLQTLQSPGTGSLNPKHSEGWAESHGLRS